MRLLRASGPRRGASVRRRRRRLQVSMVRTWGCRNPIIGLRASARRFSVRRDFRLETDGTTDSACRRISQSALPYSESWPRLGCSTPGFLVTSTWNGRLVSGPDGTINRCCLSLKTPSSGCEQPGVDLMCKTEIEQAAGLRNVLFEILGIEREPQRLDGLLKPIPGDRRAVPRCAFARDRKNIGLVGARHDADQGFVVGKQRRGFFGCQRIGFDQIEIVRKIGFKFRVDDCAALFKVCHIGARRLAAQFRRTA